MKGLTHFMSGVALASFFSEAVTRAASSATGVPGAESSFILALGGLYGIMPDTLDFKFGQFLSLADHDVDCDPVRPDPQRMARQIGEAMDEAFERDTLVKVQLYPMRMGTNLWRQYVIHFDGDRNEVVVVLNDIVSTSQIPYPGTAPRNRVGRYALRKGRLLETHGRPSVVDILSGPQFGFRREGEHVLVEFLPWHRTWSHSYVVGLMLAAPLWLLAWAAGWPSPWLYGLVAFLGFAIHITEDLTGHMGGSLIWPFDSTRYNGACWFRASNPHMNFLIDYTCVVIILFNLDRMVTQVAGMPAVPFFLLFWALPVAIYLAVVKFLRAEEAGEREEAAVKAKEAIEDHRRLERLVAQEELLFEDDNVGA